MDRNTGIKIAFIIVLALVAVWTVYPPDKTLKPGIDLAGGTSLVYEIDAEGLTATEKNDLATNMISVLRRRIDPQNVQNLIWRPQGDTRFEIQMPLASAKAREKRQAFEDTLEKLMAENLDRTEIMVALGLPPEEREKVFLENAPNSPGKLEVLKSIAEAYDQYYQFRTKSDELNNELSEIGELITDSGLDLQILKSDIRNLAKLKGEKLQQELTSTFITDPNEPDTNKKLDLLTRYVNTYKAWAEASNELTEPETGKMDVYNNAKRELDKLILTEEQITSILEMDDKAQRDRQLGEIKQEFSDRDETKIIKLINEVIKAYDDYRYGGRFKGKLMGRLDDPADLRRLLKGAGILEFRILPTRDNPKVDMEKIDYYVEQLKEKGPKFTPDNDYVWSELEQNSEWFELDSDNNIIVKPGHSDRDGRPPIIAEFGNKFYVLASNKTNECMLHNQQDPWKLENASAGTNYRTGTRAIDFVLDAKGGKNFANVTANNIDRPLCILLDGFAISAPNINSVIVTQGQITGDFTSTEQMDMVNKLNAGRLPARLIEPPISIKTIGPSIGAANRDQGIEAGIIGLILVIVFMIIYYTVAGSIADIALLLNILFVLAIMVMLRATFTLPGIAGIILTIGMSVDANVLIFERIREEQAKGSSLAISIKNGYQRALSTIFDANITTFITATILYGLASEEIKGFAIVLMLGIISSMFTALFVTRVIFNLLVSTKILKNKLFMLQIVKSPNVNWMKLRPVFFAISLILIISGFFVFFTRDDSKNSKYDIEFTGGTSVVVEFKEGVELTRDMVEKKIQEAGSNLNNPALAMANVYSIGTPFGTNEEEEKLFRQYEINTTETNKVKTTVSLPEGSITTTQEISAALGNKLPDLSFTIENGGKGLSITTSELNRNLVNNVIQDAFPDSTISEPQVQEIVNDAIITAFGDELEPKQSLEPQITETERIDEQFVDTHPEFTDYLGGVRIDCTLGKPATLAQIKTRFQDTRTKPDIQDLRKYPYKILTTNLTETQDGVPVKAFVFISSNEDFRFAEPDEEQWNGYVADERTKVLTAMQLSETLPRVTQIDPSIGDEAKTSALIAIIFSLIAIVAYIWIRFGNFRYGIAAILALVHDVCIALGAVTACTYLANTAVGNWLLIGDFKINLAIIAAFLTIIGYSLNDTIVVFDRIRENRKKAQLNHQTITNSINQTISRTIMTSLTTFIVVLIMYIFGGQALRGFTFAIGIGIIIGTYSSIAIASPLLLLGVKKKANK